MARPTPLQLTGAILPLLLTAEQVEQVQASVTLAFEGFEAAGGRGVGTPARQLKDAAGLIASLPSAELRAELSKQVAAEDAGFFQERALRPCLQLLSDETAKFNRVKLAVAVPFKKPDLEQMAALLRERVGKPVVLELTVERGLLGGAVVQYGSYRIDASIKSRLQRFRAQWQEARAS